MSEIIELTEKDLKLEPEGTFFGWFIMETLGAYLDQSKVPWAFGQRLEISLIINGHFVPIRPVIEMIEKSLDKLVLKKAEQLLQDKLCNMRTTLLCMEQHVHEEFVKLGLER